MKKEKETIYFPPQLKKKLKQMAKRNKKSFSQTAVALIEAKFNNQGGKHE